ncbi:MAG: aldehyde dehydrogenase family protein [Acidimicrobiales bacterium]|jgi:aldehyde dehydrogenase (NAD+)|nr:aldehyde dehydrogenase family protein [Acidimicrobiales bacterium]
MNTTDTIGGHLIAGEWSTDGPTAVSDNPARPDDPVGEYVLGDAATAASAVGAAAEALPGWRSTTFVARAAILERAAALLDAAREDLAVLCTLEEGKTIAESRGEAALAAETFRFHAGMAKISTERVFPSPTPGETIRTVRTPLGVVGIITPWNFPLQIPAWKIAPALASGNAVVWKPASNTPLLSVAIARILAEAGVPAGVLNLILGPGSTGAALVADPRVDGVSFTGSVPVGEAIRDTVTARNGRVQLELGGHNPAIVFEDADLDLAVPCLVAGAMGATGQKCTATRRIIAVGDIHDALLERMAEGVTALAVGDGMTDGIGIGPLVSTGAREEVAGALANAISQGASVVAAAADSPDEGCFFPPTLLSGDTSLSIAHDEVFGPISTILRVDSEDDAFSLANATEFGLSSSVFTNDLWRIDRAIHELESGIVKVNAPTTGSELHVPFGGEKSSSAHAPREQGDTAVDFFTRTRSAYIRPGTVR